VKVSVRTHLDTDIDTAWDMLHTPSVFQRVSSPFTVFRSSKNLPTRFHPDTDYEVSVSAFGLVPLGRQIIRLEDTVDSWMTRQATDVGRGVSGPLGVVTNWRHRMSVAALEDGSTEFSDQLTANASWLTPFLLPAFAVFWRWRLFRLRALARAMTSPGMRQWNERYSSNQRMWSGSVNPVLEEVAASLTPGSALDVGAGEGGDAIWLAEHGWDTTATDASSVAIYRGASEAITRSLDITWRVADLVTEGLPEGAFDLVSLHFIHIAPDQRGSLWRAAASRVSPGGTLLIVGHSVKDLDAGVRRPPQNLLFDESSFDLLEPATWSSWSVTERERTIARDGHTVTIWDVVLVATR
jgi:SAM-dependent methyltransferase